MSTVAEIREAIEQLNVEERAGLMSQLLGYDEDDEWDRQMKADAAAGKFDAMHARAIAELKAGRCVPLEDGL